MKKRITGLVLLAVIALAITGGYKIKQQKSVEKKEVTVNVMHAEYPEYDTAQDLVEASDLVFSGTVREIDYQMIDVSSDIEQDNAELMPYTLYTIDVENVYKGNIDAPSIIIKRLGGSFAGNEYLVEGSSEIAEGGDYLFLTETYENTYPSLLNVTQSSYEMNELQVLSGDEDGKITLSDILSLF